MGPGVPGFGVLDRGFRFGRGEGFVVGVWVSGNLGFTFKVFGACKVVHCWCQGEYGLGVLRVFARCTS